MNPDTIKAWLAKNKLAAGAAGVVIVGALALRSRATSAGVGSATPAASVAGLTPSYSSGAQLSPATGYNSTASDVYNAIQPQLESLQSLMNQQPSPIPVPAAAPTSQGFYRRKGTAAVYQAMSDGTLRWLDSAAYGAAGKPSFTDLAATDPVFNRTLVGAPPPAWSTTSAAPPPAAKA